MRIVRRVLGLLGVIFGFIPLASFAHVKWFAHATGDARPYQLTDTPVLIAIVCALGLIGLGVYLEHKLSVPQRLAKYIELWAPRVLSLASIGFGAAFVLFSLNGFVFAPNLPASGTSGLVLLVLQALAGLCILFGFYERIGGALVILLFILSCTVYGPFEMLDTLEMLGFAFYALIIGRPLWKIRDTQFLQPLMHRIHEYGLPILRVGTGLNLIVLGFTEKILAPELTADFLAHFHWNFMQLLGMHAFSDYWFAFSAGVVEALFGIFFVLGLVTRTTTLVLAVFLATTLVLLGPVELLGHLPHFSIAIVLAVLGRGSKLHLVGDK